jgi:hypothetical protein
MALSSPLLQGPLGFAAGWPDDRFDRRVGVTTAATVAPSSRRVSANQESFRVDDLIGWLREAIAPLSTTSPGRSPA